MLHPRNPYPHLSFAIPEEPAGGDLSGPLGDLVAVFEERGRIPRLEFVEAFAPDQAASLEAIGFALELRTPIMVCDRAGARAAPDVPGLRITRLRPDTPLDEVQTLITVGRRAFGAGNEEPASEEDAEEDRSRLDRDISILGYLDGEPAAVAQAMEPLGGLAEIGGIGTLAEFRTRGIASAMTAEVTRLAFEAGAELAYLTPGDEGAFRVYERAGYRTAEWMRFYRLAS
jgi:ribosomal protein S18 acetylase RimI-like enzyme